MEVCNPSCMPMMGMPMMNLPCQQHDMMPPPQLEKMYPNTFYIIHPVVEKTCNNMHSAYGPMYTPTQEQMEKMIDSVYKEVEPKVYEAVRESPSRDERQFSGGGRRILRDLIGILLIGRLLGGRPYYGYPNYYNFPGYYGYPGYYNPMYGGY